MATEYIWRGGAAVVTQVDTFTVALTWTTNDTLRITLTSEGNSTQFVEGTSTGTNEETDVRDVMLALLQANVQTLFQAVTWASSGSFVITGTAKVSGVPFYSAVSSSTGGDGTWALVNTTLSEGPEDRNVDGSDPAGPGSYASTNWITAAGADSVKPADGASNVKFNQGSWDMRYGLVDASGYDEIRRTPAYTGTIGDAVAGYYWTADCDNAAAKAWFIDAVQGETWIEPTGENCFIVGTGAGANAVKFGASSDLTGIYCTGQGVRGNVTCLSGMALDNIEMVDCPQASMDVGAVTSLDRVDVGAGLCDLDMGTNTVAVRLQTWGSGVIRHQATVAVGDVSVVLAESYGGTIEWNGEGKLTLLKVHGGLFTLENSVADVATITTTNQTGGIVREGGMNNATWSTYNQNGGTANVSATINKWTDVAI